MITCVITICEIKPGVVGAGMEANNSNGTILEKYTASILDKAVQVALRMILEKAKKGDIVEGEKIEEHVRAMLHRAIVEP